MRLAFLRRITRVILLIVTLSLAVGCTSFSQMPSSTMAPIVERSYNTKVEPQSQVPVPELKFEEVDVPKDVVLEITPIVLIDPEIDILSFRFKLPIPYAQNIVELATQNAYVDFPTKNDLLAIMAVESSYNSKAKFRGSYGLMQIEKKSHAPALRGRNILDISVNIEIGASVLREYYILLDRNKKAALLAYNCGIGNYLKHRYKLDYYLKYLQQLRLVNS